MWTGAAAGFSGELVFILRMGLAVLCGALIGLEREKRQKTAGIRTHILVALTAALMVIVSKYGFFDVIGIDGISIDAGRIAAAAVSAVGFLGTGVIFVRRDSAMGLTTAAGLWATVGVGIALGAGMYVLGIAATVLVLLMQALLHLRYFKTMSHLSGELKVNLTDQGLDMNDVRKRLADYGFVCRSIKIKKGIGGTVLTCLVYIPSASDYDEKLLSLSQEPWVEELLLTTLS